MTFPVWFFGWGTKILFLTHLALCNNNALWKRRWDVLFVFGAGLPSGLEASGRGFKAVIFLVRS